MDWKKIGKALLYPHKVAIAALTPIAIALLILSAVLWEAASFPSVIAYVISAYTLTVWCFAIPDMVVWFKRFKAENKYARRWQEDTRWRVKVSLCGSFFFNAVFALFQLGLGLYHRSFWFYSLGAYYMCLALMRFFLLSHTEKYAPGEKVREELRQYRICGWAFLALNLALSLIVFFMVYWGRTFRHHMITAIAIAAYTFFSFAVAIVNVVKYRKYQSPLFSASKAISLASALVSMLTLTSTLMTAFGDGTMDLFTKKLMLGGVGAAVSVTVVLMAVSMIVRSTEKIKKEENNGE